METKDTDYQMSYDPETQTVTLGGVMRLHGNDYNEMVKLLHNCVTQRPDLVTLDTRELKFLNSSGINHLLQFAVKLRNQSPATELIVKGSSEIPWQQKSLKNMQTLNRKVDLVWT
jgi:hypothetical protein